MAGEVTIEEKYERNGWPSIRRPDLKPPAGWSLSLLTGVHRIYNHCLSPDGKTIAFIMNVEKLADVYTVPASGGWPTRMTTDRVAIQYWWDETPSWSPDSQWLAFCNSGHVFVAPAAGGLPKKISGFTQSASSPVWMPDSFGLIVSVDQDENTRLLLTDRDGSWPRPLTSMAGDDSDAQPSPDGQWVAYVHRSLEDLNRLEIRMVEVASCQTQVVTSEPKLKNWSPRWSPDGTKIAFLSQRSGFNEVWLVNRDGTGLFPLTHAGLELGDLSWSPDGKWLAATANRGGAFDLVLIQSDDGSMVDLRRGAGIHLRPNWSPAGDFLTCEYMTPRLPPDIYRLSLANRSGNPISEKDVTQLTYSNLPSLACLPMAAPEPVRYQSYDGLAIQGFLYHPARPNGAAILHPHGGPRDQYGYEWDLFAQYLIAKGYTFLAINYRGGTGYGVDFEHANDLFWGIGDTQDCLYGARFLAEQDGIDTQRIGIMGSSYGGYMVACCLSRDPEYRFACGVSLYGDANLFSSWAQCDRDTRLYTEMQMGHPSHQRQGYLAGSPIQDVTQVKKPVLILHGLDDLIVPTQASEEWVEALRKADKTFEYKTYADESHGFLSRNNLLDKYNRIERFLDWYLLPSA